MLWVKSKPLPPGREDQALEILNHLLAKSLVLLPPGQQRDLGAVLRGMNRYYSMTGDYSAMESPTNAFYCALADWQTELEAEEPSATAGGMENRRTCPQCGLGWKPEYFVEGSSICVGCQERITADKARSSLSDWEEQRLAGGSRQVVDGASGDFGYDASNPIPAFEEPGESYYCACLRCPNDHPFYFQRLGSGGISPDGHVVDVFELQCFQGETSLHLYFDFYHPGGSPKVPCGLSLDQPRGCGTASARLAAFPEDAKNLVVDVPRTRWHRFDLWYRRPAEEAKSSVDKGRRRRDSTSVEYRGLGREHVIRRKRVDGNSLILDLDDGSSWVVFTQQASIARRWLPFAPVRVSKCEPPFLDFPFQLTCLETDQEVFAQLL